MDNTKTLHLEMLNYLVTCFLSITGFFLLIVWFGIAPDQAIELRVPFTASEMVPSQAVQKVDIDGFFIPFSGTAGQLQGEWGRFRGGYSNNISRENVPLLDSVDESAPPVLWSVKLGEGYAGAAVKNGCVYIMDYDKEEKSDVLRCFSFDDGSEIWRRGYRITIKRNHGYSRTVPAVSDKYAVTIGPKGQVMCVDALNGDFKWGIDLQAEYDAKIPLWYTGQCPLIDGTTAVVAPAGKALLIGVDLETGEVVWETPNPGSYDMSHSSIIPMTLGGTKMYVYCAIGGVSGVSASGEDRGKLLWQTGEWTQAVISPSPVQISDDRLFVTAGYGGGSMMFKVAKEKDVFTIEKLFSLDKTVFACEQHTPVYYKGHLFSVLPNDAGELNRQLVCMTPEGEIAWSSGKENRFGMGPFVIADDKIFVLDDDGLLTVAEATTASFRKLGQAQVLHGRESWAPIAVSHGRMLVRDFTELVCLDVRRK